MMESIALDAAGHRCSPATMPGYHQGRAPGNEGMRYPADPLTIEVARTPSCERRCSSESSLETGRSSTSTAA